MDSGSGDRTCFEPVDPWRHLAGNVLLSVPGNPAGEIDRQYLDSTKIREVTGWEPQLTLEEGIRHTLEWYRRHPEARAPAPA